MSEKLGKAALIPLLLAAASPLARGEETAPAPVTALAGATAESSQALLALEAPEAPTVGPYRLLRELGSGGMGTVYLAESSAAPHRRVALKLLREGLFTAGIAARFEEERRALTVLEHDHVVRLFDAGQHADGRPWLALEYVDGEPITVYCDRKGLDVEARLRLFVEVCGAVEHLHRRGFLHRDLKPANLLVTERDGRPVPKLIDLGLVRRLDAEEAEETLVGTPAYMAPEQFWLGAEELDARCDVFALGLVLRELLIGARPVRGVPIDLVRQATLLERPLPSVELATLGADAAAIARRRASRPGALARRLRGALDRCVQRATAGPRNQRHVSVTALKRELEQGLHRHATRQRTQRLLGFAALAATGGFLAGLLAG